LGGHTPSKYLRPVLGEKHTSLNFLVVRFLELRADGVLRS
jgi:hypothetical protein